MIDEPACVTTPRFFCERRVDVFFVFLTFLLTTALYERFSSRGEADFQDKLLSAMRFEFGGHLEKTAQ